MVVRGRVSSGDKDTAARASSAICPLVLAVILAVVVVVAVAVCGHRGRGCDGGRGRGRSDFRDGREGRGTEMLLHQE